MKAPRFLIASAPAHCASLNSANRLSVWGVGPRRVVTGGKRGTTLHDLVGLEQRGEQQGDGGCVDEVVEPTQLSPGGHGRRERLTMDADCGDLLCSRFSVAAVQGALEIAYRHCQRYAIKKRQERGDLVAKAIGHVDRTNITLRAYKLTFSVLQPAVNQATASGWLSLFDHQAAW